jgi:tartrate dehydrogenase/decarboxylase/D-malate dehydrogenase
MSRTLKIGVIPGDGIGPDVTEAALRVIDAADTGDASFDYTTLDWGCAHYQAHGAARPDDYLEIARGFDAIYLGAIGWPALVPDHLALEPLISIRQAFDQYACVRPARTFPGIPNPLADGENIDLVVVRENTEGEYVSIGGRFKQGRPDEVAVQTAQHTRKGIERILRFGFELAGKRRQRLTMITKSNALKYGMVLWDDVLDIVAPDYPDVVTDKMHVDAASMKFVQDPRGFDVVVASNLFGDILSDLSGAITGSLGLNPSANLNPERSFPSLFEPVHGSAPDIAGQGIANPVAAVFSAAMMLDWLGFEAAATAVNTAVEAAIADGARTRDLGGTLSTTDMADAILQNLG